MCDVHDVGYFVVIVEIIVIMVHVIVSHNNDFLLFIVCLLLFVKNLLPSIGLVGDIVAVLNIE